MPGITNKISIILLFLFSFQSVIAEKDKEKAKETSFSSFPKTPALKYAPKIQDDSDNLKEDEITIRVICETEATGPTRAQADDIEKGVIEEDAENTFEKRYFACLRRPAFLISRSSKFIQYFSWFCATALTGGAVLNTTDETTANGLATSALVFNIMGIAAAGVQAYAEKFLEEAEERQ